MKYKTITVTRRGGPEAFKVIENELRPPSAQKVRVKVLAAPVSLPDVEARYGRTPFAPRVPFVPGYGIIGVVDAVGREVTATKVGDNVAALTIYGGYTEYMYLAENQLIDVPAALDPAEAAPLVLNYIVAYQVLHRSAKVKEKDTVLIIGASGGIGTAFLQLGSLANLKMYGLASPEKHHILTAYKATPIDYHTQDFVEVIGEAEPDGLDAVVDGIGGDYINRGFSLLRRGGTFVEYANPLTVSRMVYAVTQIIILNLLPNGKSAKYYSTGRFRINRKPFLKDWATLFNLLKEEKIHPVIMKKFPLLKASKANELLESGKVIGNIVLVAPELL